MPLLSSPCDLQAIADEVQKRCLHKRDPQSGTGHTKALDIEEKTRIDTCRDDVMSFNFYLYLDSLHGG